MLSEAEASLCYSFKRECETVGFMKLIVWDVVDEDSEISNPKPETLFSEPQNLQNLL